MIKIIFIFSLPNPIASIPEIDIITQVFLISPKIKLAEFGVIAVFI